ncbi:MAG: hypothetical protein JWL77_3927 [Chthonomonadaceae bacterium]|nr:hypothetical protein [Chthonomonadaceae bacterium]
MKRTRAKRRVWWASIVVILAFAAAGIARFWPRPSLLTTIARPVSGVHSADDWHSYWLTTNQLLILTTEQEPTQLLSSQGVLVLTHWKGSADLLNIDTGIRTRLSGLTELLQKDTIYPILEPSEFQLSPDGAWILWKLSPDPHSFIILPERLNRTKVQRKRLPQSPPRSDYRAGVNGVIATAHLDGTHYRKWNIGHRDEEFFLDARHQVQMMAEEPLLVVHDLQNPNKDREYPKQEQAKTVLAQCAAQHPIFVTARVGPDGLGQFWIETIDTYRTQDRLELLRASPWDFGAPPPMQKRRIQMPLGTAMASGDVSPHQQYISYSITVSRVSPVRKWLHRLLPKFDSKPITTEELWISRADGQDMHEIGYVPSEADDIYRLTGTKWLPDDKHLSFYYNNRLYIVPTGSTK